MKRRKWKGYQSNGAKKTANLVLEELECRCVPAILVEDYGPLRITGVSTLPGGEVIGWQDSLPGFHHGFAGFGTPTLGTNDDWCALTQDPPALIDLNNMLSDAEWAVFSASFPNWYLTPEVDGEHPYGFLADGSLLVKHQVAVLDEYTFDDELYLRSGSDIGVEYVHIGNNPVDVHWIQIITTTGLGRDPETLRLIAPYAVDGLDTNLTPFYDEIGTAGITGFIDTPLAVPYVLNPQNNDFWVRFNATTLLVGSPTQVPDYNGVIHNFVPVYAGFKWGYQATNANNAFPNTLSDIRVWADEPASPLSVLTIPGGLNVAITELGGQGAGQKNPDHGEIELLPNGTIQYTAGPGFATVGEDSYTYTISDGIISLTGTVYVTVDPAGAFIVNAPAGGAAGDAVAVTVRAVDANNDIATNYNGSIYFASSDAYAELPENATLTSGIGVFTVKLKTAGTQFIRVSDPELWSVQSDSGIFTVAAAPVSKFVVNTPGVEVGTGWNLNFTVTALDDYNNVATGYAGTVHFISSDTAATLPANTTLAGGIGTFSATLATSGTQIITLTDTNNDALNKTFNALSPFNLIVVAPGSTTAGSAINISVTAVDYYGGTLVGYNGRVAFSDNSSAVGPLEVLGEDFLTDGVGVFSVTPMLAGFQELLVNSPDGDGVTVHHSAVSSCGLA